MKAINVDYLGTSDTHKEGETLNGGFTPNFHYSATQTEGQTLTSHHLTRKTT